MITLCDLFGSISSSRRWSDAEFRALFRWAAGLEDSPPAGHEDAVELLEEELRTMRTRVEERDSRRRAKHRDQMRRLRSGGGEDAGEGVARDGSDECDGSDARDASDACDACDGIPPIPPSINALSHTPARAKEAVAAPSAPAAPEPVPEEVLRTVCRNQRIPAEFRDRFRAAMEAQGWRVKTTLSDGGVASAPVTALNVGVIVGSWWRREREGGAQRRAPSAPAGGEDVSLRQGRARSRFSDGREAGDAN